MALAPAQPSVPTTVDEMPATINDASKIWTIETVGMNVSIKGNNMNYEEISRAIETIGAVVHSLDEIAIGERIIPRITASDEGV